MNGGVGFHVMGQMDDYVSVALEHKFVAYNGVFLSVCVCVC